MKNLTGDGLQTPSQTIHYTLRIAAAMCFIGHGAFGIITKPIWCNYFAVLGIGHDTAYRLMPWLGTADILMGLSLLFYPIRAVAGWLVVWGIVTGSLRPLSGEPFAELIERAGNYGAPLALLLLAGNGNPHAQRLAFFKARPTCPARRSPIPPRTSYVADRRLYAAPGTWLAQPHRKERSSDSIFVARLLQSLPGRSNSRHLRTRSRTGRPGPSGAPAADRLLCMEDGKPNYSTPIGNSSNGWNAVAATAASSPFG